MAKLPDGIFGGFRGRIGNVVGVKRNGTYHIRSVPAKVKNPNTPKQKAHRARFAATTRLATQLQPFLESVHATNHKKSWRGSFISNNIKAAFPADEEGNVQLHAPELILSLGALKTPGAPSFSYEESALLIEVTWTDNSGSGNARSDDSVHLLGFHPDKKMAVHSKGPILRKNESAHLQLPESADASAFYLYISVISSDRTLASNSICLGSIQ